MPGESVDILLTLKVHLEIAQQLAEGLDSLDDTLILRLEGGRYILDLYF